MKRMLHKSKGKIKIQRERRKKIIIVKIMIQQTESELLDETNAYKVRGRFVASAALSRIRKNVLTICVAFI